MSEAVARVESWGYYPTEIVSVGPRHPVAEIQIFRVLTNRGVDGDRRVRLVHNEDDTVCLETYYHNSPNEIETYLVGGPGASESFEISNHRIDVTHMKRWPIRMAFFGREKKDSPRR